MLSIKIRNAAVSVMAASSLAIAIAPAANAAPNIPGRFQKSAEGLKKTATVSCYGNIERYNQLVTAGEELLLAGKEGADAAFSAAEHIREASKNGGCSWAQ